MISELKLTDYIPHRPTPKQRAFLLLPHREAFFGGAAGGGKSDALLMGALQYADVPGYSALILRRTLGELKLPGGLLERSTEWLGPFLQERIVRYVASEHTYYFPTIDPSTGESASSAKLTFGYIGESTAYTRYQGSEFDYVAFDEVTHFAEYDYTYLFSRIRKNVCDIHSERDKNGSPIYHDDCLICQQRKNTPLRLRAASNPGGMGHRWVKARFRIDYSEEHGKYIGMHPDRPFIPAFLNDNPYIDQESYGLGLDELEEVTKKQLKEGDWGATAGSRFKQSWVRSYTRHGPNYRLGPHGRGDLITPNDISKIFQTLDPAASTREGPGDDVIYRDSNRDVSWSVLSTWALTTDWDLIWLDMWRDRVEIPELLLAVAAQYRKWRPDYLTCESNGPGAGVFQILSRKGFSVRSLHKVRDKIQNSTEAQLRMSQGRIWFPDSASWLKEAMDEIFYWVGHPHETDDIIDTLSDAAREVSWEAMNERIINEVDPFSPGDEHISNDSPSIIGSTNSFAPGFSGMSPW